MGQESHTAPFAKGIAAEMELLHELEGEAYWKQLKAITERKEFKPVEKGIYSAAGDSKKDLYSGFLEKPIIKKERMKRSLKGGATRIRTTPHSNTHRLVT